MRYVEGSNPRRQKGEGWMPGAGAAMDGELVSHGDGVLVGKDEKIWR